MWKYKYMCIYLGVHTTIWGEVFFILLQNNLDIKSPQASLSSHEVSPRKYSKILCWQSVHPGGCLPPVCTSPRCSGEQPKILILSPELQPHVIRGLQKDITWPEGKRPFLAFINRVCTRRERWASNPYCSTRAKLLLRQSMFTLSLRLKGKKIKSCADMKIKL